MDKEAAVPKPTEARTDPAGRALFAAAFSALLYAAPLVLPPLFLLSVVAPFPLAVQRMRGTVTTALVASLAATALIAIVFSPRHALEYLTMRALPGLVLGEAMARGRGLRRATGWTVLVVGVLSSLRLLFAHESIARQMLSGWDVMLSTPWLDGMRNAGSPAPDDRQLGGVGGPDAQRDGGALSVRVPDRGRGDGAGQRMAPAHLPGATRSGLAGGRRVRGPALARRAWRWRSWPPAPR